MVTSLIFFSIKRGVRQGCPLSPYLFIIGIELLSYAVRNNEDVSGFVMNNIEIKNTIFADDATFDIDGSEKSTTTVVKIIEEFYKISGLKLNTSKSVMLRIGNLINTEIEFCKDRNINWTSSCAKTLGMIFHTDNTKLFELNFEPKLKEFYHCLKLWKKRNLTVLGKIVVLKSYALPKILYPLMMLPNPDNDIIKKINMDMYEFLWNTRTDKISRKTIVQDIENGGLRMINFPFFLKALKASWVKRFINKDDVGIWKTRYTKLLERAGGNFFFECNFSPGHVRKIFYENAFF